MYIVSRKENIFGDFLGETQLSATGNEHKEAGAK